MYFLIDFPSQSLVAHDEGLYARRSRLLEDTANTTLQEQNSADSSNRFAAKATDSYSRAVDSSDPVELFGEASNNWAALAFSDNK